MILQEPIFSTYSKKRRFGICRCIAKDKTDILGYIDIYETLGQQDDFLSLEPFIKPLVPLNADMPVIEALNTMRNNRLQIALVARFDRHANPLPLGIVTMKDLVEELIGELAEW